MKKFATFFLVLILIFSSTLNVLAVEEVSKEKVEPRVTYIYNYTGDPYDSDKSNISLGSFSLQEGDVVTIYTGATGVGESTFRFHTTFYYSTSYVIGGDLKYEGTFIAPKDGVYNLIVNYKNNSGTITIQIF